jgi:NTP pyrophosphatase (non-canonical NTP hydrolase)
VTVQIREYQEWLEAWDRGRGWDRVALSHTLVHAVGEVGEGARLGLQWEGYKDASSPTQLAADLEEELSDVFVFLFKIAYQTGVDVESALVSGQAKAEGRHFDLAKARAELARYHARQAECLARMAEGSSADGRD